ncbi:MAG: trehalose-6-phosphate synthase [Anaerolineales bacterium]|jgi:trehalose 6-phosphate synthase
MDEEADLPARGCPSLEERILEGRRLIIASNRGPVSFQKDENGEINAQRGGGGLVTALTGVVRHVEATWISSAMTEEDRAFNPKKVPLGAGDDQIEIEFVAPDAETYDKYYNIISNPLLWFLQHNMWDIATAPTIDRTIWDAWENGYVAINRMFADAIIHKIYANTQPAIVMIQDYQLYLVPYFLRKRISRRSKHILVHFIHIPWPGTEDWGVLPPVMREAILEGLCAVDLLGFQTRDDGLNFIRTCQSHLEGAHVNFKKGRVWYRNHATYVRDFPISIDVPALRKLSASEDVRRYGEQIDEYAGDAALIVRIDRTEPSKNIVRGFQAMEELLELYPEYRKKVHFLAMLVPSRMEVAEYQDYLDELMAAAGRVNANYGDSEWEPVRVMVGENYPRAVAALQRYDILLVNSIADGMNLVAKEGPIVNQKNGVEILSERTGARQQLEEGAIVISPCDIYATAQAMHQALMMHEAERLRRSARLVQIVEENDINAWLCAQLEAIGRLVL